MLMLMAAAAAGTPAPAFAQPAATARPAATAPAATAPAAARGGERAELEKIIQRRVLPNGFEVIVVENHAVPLATVEITVRNGAFTQTPEFAGLAHMHEHMFFKANARLSRPDEFIDRASELGATFNAQAQEERVRYYITLPADSVAGGLEMMSWALRSPLYLRQELERERQVVIGEYDRAESSPFFKLTQEMGKTMWGDLWSRKNTIGDREVIATTTPEKMRAIQSRYYVPNNTAVIITGDVDPARVFAHAEQYFGDWKRAPDPFEADPIPPMPALTHDRAVLVEQPVAAVTVFLEWQGPSVRKDPAATYAADVFSDALNDPGSTLQRKLVDTGLWQSLGVNYYTLNQVGPISISGQTTPERLREALAALEAEIGKLASPGYITQDELEAVKAKRTVSSAFGRERASAFGSTIGFWWSVADLEYYMGYIDNMAAQTLDDLRGYARKYIIGKPRVTGVLIHPDARKAIDLTEADLLRRGAQ